MSDLPVFPADRPIYGCLPRKSLPGKYPMAADRIPLVDENQWDALAAQISVRPFMRTMLDQDSVGSCACESSDGATMIARAMAGLPHVTLNPWFLYHFASGGSDNGSSIDTVLELLMEIGCASEAVWPRSKGWRAKPSPEAMADALQYRIAEFWDISSTAEMVSALLAGFPVVFGSQGHAICAVEHKKTYPLILNSWGSDWEDGGFGKWVNYNAVNWGYGAYCVRVAT